MHIAGKPAVNDRNGTWDFLQACPDGTVTTQSTDLAWNIRRRYRHSKVYTDIPQPQQIYTYGDILVLPRKYGGNCLPLNEALSSGMPVIMTDISPNNHLLPKEWLVPAYKTDTIEPRTIVDVYTADTHELYQRIQWVKDNIESQSQRANEIADTISWQTLLPKWEEAIYG
jgi:glycosyltransferase involved in cell wall biosynthesis